MTTRAEEIAAEGPYHVEKSSGVWVIMGPQGRWPFHFNHESTAKIRADDFNKVYKQGQQDRWIPVSERLPEMREESRGVWQSSYVLVRIDRETDEQYRTKLAFLCQLNGGDAKWRSAGLGGNVTHWMPLPSPPNPEQR